MKNVWINIWDFLRAENKADVRRFESEAALATYTMKKSSRKYPRDMIEKDSPLKLLMANIVNPRYTERGRKGRS
jgi:hypothetical protein